MSRTRPISRKDQVLSLVSIVQGADVNKNPTETPVKRTVFAAKKSVGMREHYTAAAFDMRPEIVFVAWQREYQGEMLIEHNSKEYQLIRTYEPNLEEVELVCSRPGPRPRSR